jgi:hypothetical protein
MSFFWSGVNTSLMTSIVTSGIGFSLADRAGSSGETHRLFREQGGALQFSI